jgi:hypothetical protein
MLLVISTIMGWVRIVVNLWVWIVLICINNSNTISWIVLASIDIWVMIPGNISNSKRDNNYSNRLRFKRINKINTNL